MAAQIIQFAPQRQKGVDDGMGDVIRTLLTVRQADMQNQLAQSQLRTEDLRRTLEANMGQYRVQQAQAEGRAADSRARMYEAQSRGIEAQNSPEMLDADRQYRLAQTRQANAAADNQEFVGQRQKQEASRQDVERMMANTPPEQFLDDGQMKQMATTLTNLRLNTMGGDLLKGTAQYPILYQDTLNQLTGLKSKYQQAQTEHRLAQAELDRNHTAADTKLWLEAAKYGLEGVLADSQPDNKTFKRLSAIGPFNSDPFYRQLLNEPGNQGLLETTVMHMMTQMKIPMTVRNDMGAQVRNPDYDTAFNNMKEAVRQSIARAGMEKVLKDSPPTYLDTPMLPLPGSGTPSPIAPDGLRSAPPTAPTSTQTEEIQINPRTGEKIRFDPQTGKWVPFNG